MRASMCALNRNTGWSRLPPDTYNDTEERSVGGGKGGVGGEDQVLAFAALYTYP